MRADFTISNPARIYEAIEVDIVSAVDKNDVGEGHASHTRNQTPGHDLIFGKEAFVARIATEEASRYNDGGKDGAPPAVEEGWIVGDT